MQEVYRLTRKVARTNASVLLLGETGTGKEMIATAIHRLSGRASGPFVRVNCGALSESLLESELFGHVRGSFTGAVNNRTGRFEAAHTGSIFLDEINSTSLLLQVKLLRVLQEREFERVGDSRTVKVDVRIVAATNADLLKMVKDGTFREDLYYRLNVIAVQLTPLRERPDDIPPLVQAFIEKMTRRGTPLEERRGGSAEERSGSLERPDVTVSQEAMRRLMSHPWPGNVRQLENAIERALAMLGGRTQIEVADLPPDLQLAEPDPVTPSLDLPENGIDLPAMIAQIEKGLIDRALTRTAQNRGAAARLLGLKRTTLVEKLKRM